MSLTSLILSPPLSPLLPPSIPLPPSFSRSLGHHLFLALPPPLSFVLPVLPAHKTVPFLFRLHLAEPRSALIPLSPDVSSCLTTAHARL